MKSLLTALLMAAATMTIGVTPDAATPTDTPAVRECHDESTVVDHMQAQGFVLAAYLHGDAASGFLEVRGGVMPDGLMPADFISIQVWAAMPDTAVLILFDKRGCARLTAQTALRRALEEIEAFKATSI